MKLNKILIMEILLIIGAILLIKVFHMEHLFVWSVPFLFIGHCDTMGGPVILRAKKALDTGNVDLVLPWIQKKDEQEVKEIFKKAVSVRGLNKEAKELADHYFFENLVRIHRAGEGEPFTGIKEKEEAEDPVIKMADEAVDKGTADNLALKLAEHLKESILQKFHELMEKKVDAGKSVEKGREFVSTYVPFVHFVEQIHLLITGKSELHHHE